MSSTFLYVYGASLAGVISSHLPSYFAALSKKSLYETISVTPRTTALPSYRFTPTDTSVPFKKLSINISSPS